MSDAFVIAGNAQLLKNLFAFRAFKFLLGAMNPAGRHAASGCRQHEVADDERSVVKIGWFALVRQNDNDSRRAVERVVGRSKYLAVDFGQLIPEFFVCNSNHNRRLKTASGGGKRSGFENLVEDVFRNRFRLEISAASPSGKQ